MSPSSDSFFWVGFISCVKLNYHRSWVSQKSCCQLPFSSQVFIANSEKYTLADFALSINGSKRGWGMHLNKF